MIHKGFLDLPDELQIHVIGTLDWRDVLACKKVNSSLAQLIDTAVELQYKLELAKAGMIDGPPGGTSIRARLDALRAYRASWASGEHPSERVRVPNLRTLRSNPGGGAFSHYNTRALIQTSPLAICAPSQPFSGVEGRCYEYEGWGAIPEGRMGISYQIDLAQDLLVHTWNVIVDDQDFPNGDEVVYPECGVASLTDKFKPHPLASRPTLRACLPTILRATIDELQIFGDLVLWNIMRGGQDTEMLAFNWKTGTIVWHMHGRYAMRAVLLTQSKLAVIDENQLNLRIFKLDAGAQDDCPLLALDAHLCLLELPPRSDAAQSSMSAMIQHPSQPPPGVRPKFMWDPELTVLALAIRFIPPRPLHTIGPIGFVFSENYILYVPISSLSNLPSDGEVIAWDGWGPHATRMLAVTPPRLPSTVVGCRHVEVQRDQQRRQYMVTIREVFESPDDTSGSDMASGASREETSPIAGSRVWKEPIHTTFPYRTTRTVIDLEEGEETWNTAVRLSSDGLVLAVVR